MRGRWGAALWALFVVVAVVSGWAAVQMVGAAIAPASVPVLSSGEVSQRLATTTPDPVHSRSAKPSSKPSKKASDKTPGPTAGTSTPSSTPSATPEEQRPVVRTLVSRGGSVVAECSGTTAYLRSASPAVGYRVDEWERGPAAETEVRFVSSSAEVKLKVTCSEGVPTADVETDGESGDDD